MKSLIDACKSKGVHFFYGISPGLDISYSSPRDLRQLKTKLDEIKSLGCSAFALLWDDIDTTLPQDDRGAFRTLAQAHVKVTNEVFEHLGRPLFLTCPVEYCANRADPSLKDSEYLNTLGRGLDKDIKIFWTGSKVVPEFITKDEMIALKEVIRRKPVIWDNLHANDYDQQRMFLGPYSGRDPDIIPHVSGVMTNPNCEYSFNVPAMFTLAAWSHCYDRKTGNINSWNALSAAELSIPHFLEEIRRPTSISKAGGKRQTVSGMSEADRECMEINKSDVELLFHLFWLPHSNGPKAEMLINEFKYLRDQVRA